MGARGKWQVVFKQGVCTASLAIHTNTLAGRGVQGSPAQVPQNGKVEIHQQRDARLERAEPQRALGLAPIDATR